MKSKKIQGIIPPMVTPLENQDELDIEGLEKLIEHIINGGVHGLFVLGTTGEAQSLSYHLRYTLVDLAIKIVNGRIPVLAGVSDTSFVESLNFAKHAYHCGASAVVSTPPYYYTPNQKELINYFIAFADNSPLPLFLYNMPSHVKVNLDVETVVNLSMHENIIGLKDSSGNLLYFQEVVQALKKVEDFSILIGPEEMLMQSILTGGHGGVIGGANMFPKLYVEMYGASVNRDLDRMNILQEKILKICSNIYSIGNSGGGYLPGLKAALCHLGICKNVLALPYSAFGENEIREIQRKLDSMDLEEWI
ncbi:MAG: dihydrodipicolinate synthase family protein [Balneolaceae bacterium]|nr:MAG: dihydrodipicolinate synthase family protein [Balneolaceae bacterium]